MDIKKEKERPNILLISDHIRLPTGVGKMAKNIVGGSAHRFNWYCVTNNPGSKFDVEEVGSDFFDICYTDDPEVVLYPHNKKKNVNLIKTVIKEHEIDAVLFFNDPNNYYWLLSEKADQIFEGVELFYYHVWDNLPVPNYNKDFYNKFDWIGSISKLTHHVVSRLHDNRHSYVPHGVNSDSFYPITQDLSKVVEYQGEKTSEYQIVYNIKRNWIGNEDKFIVFWCNKNIQRKNAGDVIRIFKKFVKFFPESQWDNFVLMMKTNHRSSEGPALTKVADKLASGLDIRILPEYVSDQKLNWYYNISDVTLNIANREGFGLTTLESLMAGTPIIVNVTGGLQDQCGFKKENGDFLSSKDYENEWGSNSDKKYSDCGEWVYPVWPEVRTMSGTQNEPYCFDDYVEIQDVVDVLKDIYMKGTEGRNKTGIKGRTFAMKHFSLSRMVEGIIEGIEKNI